MARTNEWTETLVDWVDGRLRQNRFSNLWLGGGPGADGGSSYRPIDGQLTQRHICYDISEDVSPCEPSGFSSLVDNLRRIRYWQEPATWFGVTTSGAPASGCALNVYIKPGLWYPSTTEYCAFAGGHSPTFTLPGVLDRVDTVYIDASGILHIQRGTPAVSPTITLPPIASGIPLWAVYLTPTSSGITHVECSGYYSGMGYIERDLRPFLNLGGGAAASGVLPASNRGAILRGGVADWETYNVGTANEVLTNDGTDVIWSTGAIDLTAGKTLIVSVNLTLAGVDGKSLTIEENSILNQDLTTDASVTFADVFVPDGGTFGISGNELLTVNAAGNFTFSGVTSIVVPDGAWVGADANCAWLFDSSNGDITAQDKVGVGTTAPEGMVDIAYGVTFGKMTLLLGAYSTGSTRNNNTTKRTVVGSYHYTNAEEPLGMLYAFSSSIISRLDIGGGHIYCNAATKVSIYTAANTTTVTGTNRFSIDSTGAIIVTGPSLEVPDGWWFGIGAAVERIVIDSAGYIAFRGCNVGIGLAIPNQKLTVEGTIDLKEQAAANADVASYGQIWVKNAAPNELWFTDDTGVDVQLGLGAGGLPAVAGAGYALISTGVNTWGADLTPLWLGTHTWGSGFSILPTDASGQDLGAAGARWDLYTQDIIFGGATGANVITVPDNVADALHVFDAGGMEYLKIVTTNAQPVIGFNDAGADIDFEVEAVGVADALRVQGSDGQITFGALTAGYVKSSAGGVLSVATEVPLIDLGSYTQGDLIYGGAADWQDLAIGAIGDFLWVNAAGTEPEWRTLVAGDVPAHALLGTQHSDTTTDAPTRGSLIYANATPLWDELDHPLAAGYALITDATDVAWDQTPTWTGEHSFGAGMGFTGASGNNEVTIPDNVFVALELLDAGGLEYLRINSLDANPYFLIDPAAAGIMIGIGTASPGALLDATCTTAVTNTYQDVVHIEAVSTGDMVDDFGPRMNFAIKDGAVATQHIASIIARRDGADNTGGLLFAVKNAGAWDYTAMYINPSGAVAVKALATSAGAGLTIDAAGAITVTHSYHSVDTFGGAATDNLITINGGQDGQMLILRSANSARDPTLTQAGNIWLDAAGNFTLTSSADRITLQKQGASWYEVSRSNNN